MIEVKIGDLFQSQAQTLVNAVNCVGIMGKGVALQFKKRFPDNFLDYVAKCERGEVKLGKPYLYRQLLGQWILNFPTKDHWRSVSRLEDIVAGLKHLQENYREWKITSLAVPPLGCGQGGLEWRVVGAELYRGLSQLDIPVELYAPPETPADELKPTFLNGTNVDPLTGESIRTANIHPAWLALVEILSQIEAQPYRYPIGRVTFQKIAYFATAAGIPTGLVHVRGSFGPYASELRRVLAALQNNGLLREERHGNMLSVEVGPTFTDARHQYWPAIKEWLPIISRVADLFLRLPTRDAEVTATAHFAAMQLRERLSRRPTEREVLDEVRAWKHERLDERTVARSVRRLTVLGWLDVQLSDDLPVPASF